MTAGIRLDRLKPGQACYVLKIEGDLEIMQRLEELGVVRGTRIVCHMISSLGDPIAYGIRGAVIALRKKDAHGILVAPEDETVDGVPEGSRPI